MSAGLKAEPKLQLSVFISGHPKFGVSVLISAQAEMETETNNFSRNEIRLADDPGRLKLLVSVLISARAEMKTETSSFVWAEMRTETCRFGSAFESCFQSDMSSISHTFFSTETNSFGMNFSSANL
jgi:hypothetical protein